MIQLTCIISSAHNLFLESAKNGSTALLREHQVMLPAQHIEDEKIVVAVPINVGKIDPHGEVARGPQRQMAQRAKVAMTIVHPTAIRREGIVAHINIREPAAIDIAEHN